MYKVQNKQHVITYKDNIYTSVLYRDKMTKN